VYSRTHLNRPVLVLGLAMVLCMAAPDPLAAAQAPTRREVQSAVEQLRKDPDLAVAVTEKTLRLKERETKPDKAQDSSALQWLVQLMQWISETSRVIVWIAGAAAVAVLLVGLRRWLRARAAQNEPRRALLPSHVQSLDIRPDSLPRDIGATAAALWQRGDHRAALSLLYRGALSRLVHDHAVPIRAASTEGECVVLALARLDRASGAFFAGLVSAWQQAVYGARLPATGQALALCSDFDRFLQPGPAAGAMP
jgi:hypothetical protein